MMLPFRDCEDIPESSRVNREKFPFLCGEECTCDRLVIKQACQFNDLAQYMIIKFVYFFFDSAKNHQR